jgi:hypothetical protein
MLPGDGVSLRTVCRLGHNETNYLNWSIILRFFPKHYYLKETLLYLQQQGWITINEGLETSVDGLGTFVYQRATDLWTVTMVSLPVLGAFGVGAILGFKKG